MATKSKAESCHEIKCRMVCTPERASLRVGQAGKERACVPDRAGFAHCHRIDPRYVSLDAETLTNAGRFINY